MKDDPSNDTAPRWGTRGARVKLVRAVFQHLKDNPTARQDCLDFEKGRKIVIDVARTVQIEVPEDARVLFLPEGDAKKGDPPPQQSTSAEKSMFAPGLAHHAGSSLIIDLPPEGATIDESLKYACTYLPWVPDSDSPEEE